MLPSGRKKHINPVRPERQASFLKYFPFKPDIIAHSTAEKEQDNKGGYMIKKKESLSKIIGVFIFFLILMGMLSGVAVAQTVILNQAPDQVRSYACDNDGYDQTLADNFLLTSTSTITQIRIWGTYRPTGTAPAIDNFTVIFHSDSAGLPGAAISTQNNVPVGRQATGNTISTGGSEYVYTLTLTTPVTLTPGTYWVEIFNDTPADTDDNFSWETGALDPVNGISGDAFDTLAVPGINWNSDTVELAIEITAGHPIAVPTINVWGMFIFTLLTGLGTVFVLIRQKVKA